MNNAGLPFFNDNVTTAVQVKGAQGYLLSARLVNTVAGVGYVQIFFLPAASVVLGTTVPDVAVRLATSQDLFIDWGVGMGTAIGTGITIAATTTATGSTTNATSVLLTYQ